VAIVGSRRASPEAEDFAASLAGALTRAGAVVVSGGALGIDAAAHRGAMAAGGRTWAVAGTGCEQCFPPAHEGLFAAIGRGPGAMIWPFAPPSPARAGAFLSRNRVLVAMSDAVVVAQAGLASGALRAAACARALAKPLWVVPAPPWAENFEGSWELLDKGARPLTNIASFLRALELPKARLGPGRRPADVRRDPIESAVLAVISPLPLHLDEIAERAHVSVQAAATALLTLALDAVVVEGPPSFFRPRDGPNQ
jgi:DNA processing protein